MNLFTGQQWRNRHREQTYGHGQRGGEGEMYGKSNLLVPALQCLVSESAKFQSVSERIEGEGNPGLIKERKVLKEKEWQ